MTPPLTLKQLLKIIPYAGPRAGVFLVPITQAMAEFGIDTPLRKSAFLAQVAHESGSLRYTLELDDGEAYEGRADLGNTRPGDGPRYKGRGLIQITGRANYAACSLALYRDPRLLTQPELLEAPVAACRSAAWYWRTHGLNELADAEDFRAITRRVNGGLNGYADRLSYYSRGRQVLGC